MLTDITNIQDKNGKQYTVKYWLSNPGHGRSRYNIGIYDGSNQAGEFELDINDGDVYAEIDQTYFEPEYRRLGLYPALLPVMRDFMKTQGYKGIFSKGKLRNAMSNAAWDKIPDKKVMPTVTNAMSPYSDYVLENNSMVTSISAFKKINEDRMQQILPFEEPEFQKLSVHSHLRDAFTDLSVMRPDAYYSHSDPDDKLEKFGNKAFNFLLIEGDGDDESLMTNYVWQFTQLYSPKENPEMYSKKFLKFASEDDDENLEDNIKFAELAAKESNIKNVFSNSGWSAFKPVARESFDESLYKMTSTILDSYNKNDNGLIECWRVVNYVPDTQGDYYVNIIKHGGVGVYWSWDEKAAEAHWGESGGHSITLHGQISVENINWYETMWKNASYMSEEKEIRTIANGNVMIVGYHDNEKDMYVKLEQPVVVKTGQ